VIISERADFDEQFFMNKRHSLPQLPPPCPDSLVKPSPPIVQLPDTFDDALDDSDLSQQPVHGGDGSVRSELPFARPESPPSPSVFHTAATSSSPPASTPPTPAPMVEPAPSHPQRQRRPREEWLTEQWTVPLRYRQIREPTPVIASSDEDDTSNDPLDCLHTHTTSITEPMSYRQSQQSSDRDSWHTACEEEMEAHQVNGTWEVVKLPAGKHAIGLRWFLKVKYNADGSLECYKARLVIKGYSQCPGFDFKETFAPTVRYATIYTILAIAALEDLELCSMDISHAYLNGKLEEDIYMQQPEGFEVGRPEHVCKLRKSLYGLKQAGRVWNKTLQSVLLSMGFQQV
jgi:Reverse transcriptase (RNA-dependent DNA polymerase)